MFTIINPNSTTTQESISNAIIHHVSEKVLLLTKATRLQTFIESHEEQIAQFLSELQVSPLLKGRVTTYISSWDNRLELTIPVSSFKTSLPLLESFESIFNCILDKSSDIPENLERLYYSTSLPHLSLALQLTEDAENCRRVVASEQYTPGFISKTYKFICD